MIIRLYAGIAVYQSPLYNKAEVVRCAYIISIRTDIIEPNDNREKRIFG